MSKQTNKMKRCARKWRAYKKRHPRASYRAFMKKCLKKGRR